MAFIFLGSCCITEQINTGVSVCLCKQLTLRSRFLPPGHPLSVLTAQTLPHLPLALPAPLPLSRWNAASSPRHRVSVTREKLRSSILSSFHWPASHIHSDFSSDTLCMCVLSAELHFSLVSCGLVEWPWVSPGQCQTQSKLVTLLCLQTLLPNPWEYEQSGTCRVSGGSMITSEYEGRRNLRGLAWFSFCTSEALSVPGHPSLFPLARVKSEMGFFGSATWYIHRPSWAKLAGSWDSTKWKTWCQLEIGSFPSSSKCFRITCPLIYSKVSKS